MKKSPYEIVQRTCGRGTYTSTIIANSGDDTLFGGAGNTTLISGSGNDRIFAGTGGATIRIDPATAGTDLIGGAGKDIAGLYKDMGIGDWQGSYQHGGMYYLNAGQQSGWFADQQTVLDALVALNNGDWAGTIQDAMRNGDVSYCDPLPVLGAGVAPPDESIKRRKRVAANDAEGRMAA